jgi:hypothetical protein
MPFGQIFSAVAGGLGSAVGAFMTALGSGGSSNAEAGVQTVFMNGFRQGNAGKKMLSSSNYFEMGAGAVPSTYGWPDTFYDMDADSFFKSAFSPGGWLNPGKQPMSGYEKAGLTAAVGSDLINLYGEKRDRDLAKDMLKFKREGGRYLGTSHFDKPGEGAPFELVEAFDAKGIQAPLATTVLGGRNPAFPKGGLLS